MKKPKMSWREDMRNFMMNSLMFRSIFRQVSTILNNENKHMKETEIAVKKAGT